MTFFKIILLVRWPRNFNYNTPEKAGLSGTRNFYLTSDDGVKLGVWLVCLCVLVLVFFPPLFF